MKNTFKRLRVITLTAIIGFSMAACENPVAHTHQWGEYVVTTAATCTVKGSETRTCTLDPTHTETREIAIDPTAHNYGAWTQAKAPTETEDGEEIRTCTHSAEHKETRPIAALGHTHHWGEWTQTTAPTCTTAGIETRVCSLDATHTELRTGAAAFGHDFGEWILTTAPTVTESGIETRTCAHDPAHKETRSVSATGSPDHIHVWGDWSVTTTPACITAGEETRVCSLDSSHRETNPIDALGHDYGAWTETTVPTCTEAGIETRICSRDPSHTETQSGTAAFGHDYGDWTGTIAPTCTTAGVETRICSHDSSHTETRDGAAALGHDWEWRVTTPATVTADGIETKTCKHDSTHTDGTRTVYATGTVSLNFTLINNDTAYRVNKGTVSSGAVYIPAYRLYNGDYLPVTEIGSCADTYPDGAFSFTNITSITIPEGIISIGESAFGDWIFSQTIYIKGYASQAAADSAWGTGWRSYCNAAIRYWDGSSYHRPVCECNQEEHYLPCDCGGTDCNCDVNNAEIYCSETLPHDLEIEEKHVFLIGLDGWGSYSFENENFSMPMLKELMNNGSYTLQALNVMPSRSLPNWSSMFMGASPNITGYWTNNPSEAVSKIVDIYGLFPSIFTLLKGQRPQCKVAFFYQWKENGSLCPDNIIDTKQHINNLSNDISMVTDYIETEKPNFCSIIIGEPDVVGHSIGHNTQAYYNELSRLDGLIAQIIQSIKDSGIWDNSIIIFSSDHGGVGKGHGGNTHLERDIPFIVFGNNIKEGTKISQDVRIYDIAPTIAYIFELEPPLFWEGKVIDIFE